MLRGSRAPTRTIAENVISVAGAVCYAVSKTVRAAGCLSCHAIAPSFTTRRTSVKRLILAFLCVGFLAGSAAAADKNPIVVMETSMGTVKIELYQDKAPITVKNFLAYVDDKFYDKTIFHRVIGKENDVKKKDFMVQGGGFSDELKEKKPKAAIKNEASNGLSNTRGTLAMARLDDPDTATAQFFINVADNDFLDKSGDSAGYAVFGKVIEGMDVVNKIKAVETGRKKFMVLDPRDDTKLIETTMPNVPVENVVIKSIRRADK
jgi:cyclophilin family peptidyl-prolyl cis-trans isomerase